MKYRTNQFLMLLIISSTTILSQSVAAGDEGWFLRPNIGLSQLSDLNATANGVSGVSGSADVSLDSGVVAGVGLGYRYNKNLAAEVAWEYRSNDSAVTLADGTDFADGNYASNTFFMNAIYTFDSATKWRPYLGAGLAWVQEIDIDLEGAGRELSYSGDGDVGLQVFAGIGYQLSDSWELQAELRYASLTGIDLEAESGGAVGSFTDFDYEPTTLQLTAVYLF